MKINPGWRPFGKPIAPADNAGPTPVAPKSFSDTMQHQDDKANMEQLTRMLNQIQVQGERLTKSMTVRELRLYRQLVKQFLEETVRRGVKLKETRGWDRRGRGKRYKLLDEIDRHLLEMADEMLETEQGKIDLLVKVGEVRGMLINLFF
ncbi:YaaR family protein [Paenibacillus koleovorans]|uniref:YaaR family protein n=1 Tax=Paenibacillus koleovorans TaxID=121608 RepID=UPI000FDB4519|nr:YaaR family protein [Paenibacillus koleovorans]